MAEAHEITLLLRRIDEGQAGAMDELMRVVYGELQRMAASQLHRHFGKDVNQLTLEPAALVNESFLRLIKQRQGFDNRGHFFAIATKIMLRVLIDYRREKMAAKRGRHARVTLSLGENLFEQFPAGDKASGTLIDVEAIATALEKLEVLDSRKADIVKMRVVWGMTVAEIAAALSISPSSVDRDWRFAKVWIAEEAGLTKR